MKLITKEIRGKLLRNYRNRNRAGHDPVPAVKLFYPAGPQTWLITEMDPEQPDRVFGLCDLGFGHPELGWTSLAEMEQFRGQLKIRIGRGRARLTRPMIKIERDKWFSPSKPFSHYIQQAREKGRIEA